ncbi:DUF624 domain-containing protein [Cellulomonas cellasea]|uniref:Putative membrane protein YesL n=1 Tax=Cellulomonas cellasea TaxID=43670 RepID=A0A7W4UJH4_9CELL|nr:DUF624 domain-containing protein [Cellulomonas cellasea]MBB2924830.1 putative membrane protein YesL [Cellulomonas cellasea]
MTQVTAREQPGEIGSGVLARASATAYWYLVVEALLVLTAAPGLLALPLLARDASNVPLVALALVPLGPALSAGLFALRAYRRDPDLRPAGHFWRGYRLNWLDVLRFWVPFLAVLLVLATNLTHLGSVPGGPVLAPLLGLITLGLALWCAHMLVLVSLFSFRTRDAARLAAFFLARRPGVTLGAASLGVLATGTVLFASDWVLALLASVMVGLLLRNAGPMVADVEDRFTA